MTNLIDMTSDPAPPSSTAAAGLAIVSAPTVASSAAPALASPADPPSDPQALLEMIGRGLAPQADDATRAAARDLWARCAQFITAAAPVVGGAAIPAAAAAPSYMAPAAAPAWPPIPPLPLPMSPIAMAARAIKQMTPDQLIETLLQRLRAALPAGASVAAPRPIQFQLVPVPPPPTGER
jgi:hypothetical protein